MENAVTNLEIGGERKLYILANQIFRNDQEALRSAFAGERTRRGFWFLYPRPNWPVEPTEREAGPLLARFIADISQENRMIFLRRYWYLDTIPEIAQQCSLSEWRVRFRLNRTRGKLYAYFAQAGVSL